MPERRPVAALKVAQVGLLTIENVSVWPSGSDAVGWNEYDCSAVTLVAGVPLIEGALLAAATMMEKGASVAMAAPSLTLMETFE